MADNVAITAGSGTAIATDDVGGIHYQKTKLDGGGDGVSTPIIAGQQTMANSLPVVIASNQSAIPMSAASLPLPTSAATETSVAAAATSLAIVDDWDESDRAKVNIIAGQAGVAAGAGAVGATVQRVTHASDDPVTTSVQVMDDWDESDRAKVNLVAGQAGISAGAGAVAANTPRVTHASDDPAVAALAAIQAAAELDPASFVHKNGEWTSAQTGVALWTPGAGNKVCVTSLRVTTGGTTPAVVTVWFGASGDTTYTAGTDRTLFRGEFAPSATSRPGAIMAFPTPFVGADDHVLRVTSSAGVTLYVQADGYEVA